MPSRVGDKFHMAVGKDGWFTVSATVGMPAGKVALARWLAYAVLIHMCKVDSEANSHLESLESTQALFNFGLERGRVGQNLVMQTKD